MKRILLILALLGLAVPAFARQRISGYCEQGGKTVTTSGLTSTSTVQASYPSCLVTVWTAGTNTIVPIFTDNAGTVKGNPFTADTNGYWFFYVDNSRVDVRLSGGGIPAPFTLGDYLADDNAEMTFPFNPLAFNATPTFDASLFSAFSMTLTGNVTSSTVTNAKTGRVISILLCQDGVGGRTFAWPATFSSTPTLDARVSKCSNTVWFYNGANWKLLGSGGDSLSIAASSVIMNGAAALTLPTTSDTLMGRATADTMTNKNMSGGTLSGSITNAGTITGGTLSGYTMTGAITGTGSTTTGGTLSGVTFSGGTLSGTIAGTPTLSGAITMSSTLAVAGQVTISVATGTIPLNITSTTPVPNLTPMRANSSLTVNTANNVTFTFANPAAPRTITLNDLGKNAFVLLTGTAGQIDCDTADTLCNFNTYQSLNTAVCTLPTTAVSEWSIVGTVNAIPTATAGANQTFCVDWLPAVINLVQSAKGNNAGGATTVTTTYSAAVGHLLVASTGDDGDQTVTGCTDGTNVYTLAKRQNNPGQQTVEVWYKQNSTAVSGVTLTCTFSGSVKGTLIWQDFAGADTAAALDVSVGNTGNDTAPTSGNTAVGASGPELAVGVVAAKNLPVVTAISNAWIITDTTNATLSPTLSVETKEAPNASVQASNFTLNAVQTWASVTVLFKAAVTGTQYARITQPIRIPDDALIAGGLDVKIQWRNRLASAAGANTLLGAAVACATPGATADVAFNTESTQQTSLASVASGINETTLTSVDLTGCLPGSWTNLSVFRKMGVSGDNNALPAETSVVQYRFKHAQ